MATGVPKAPRPDARAAPLGELSLAYPGKRPEAEILGLERPRLTVAWASAAAPRNRLYFGDNAAVLRGLLGDPEVAGRVRLVYIDPPFATQSVFHSRKLEPAYEDLLFGPAYIEFLRERLVLLRELLAEDGSIYLHLDGKMVFHMKLICDEVFGAGRFRCCIVRKKCNPKNYTRKTYGNVVDYILFYTRGERYVWNRPHEAWTEGRDREYQYSDQDTGRRFMKVPLHAPGVRRGETGQPWRGRQPPPGKHWQYPPGVLEQMDARGEIYWSPRGNPRRKLYLDQSAGIPVQDLWLECKDAHNQNVRVTGYPTEKNPALLRRIIDTSSDAGDLVLDCFCGSGTTLEVAGAAGRRWIGVDQSPLAVRATLRRLVLGTEAMGDFVRGAPEPSGVPGQRPVAEFALLAGEEQQVEAAALEHEWWGLQQVKSSRA